MYARWRPSSFHIAEVQVAYWTQTDFQTSCDVTQSSCTRVKLRLQQMKVKVLHREAETSKRERGGGGGGV